MENRDVEKESPSVDNNLKSFSEKRNSRKKVAKIASVIGVFAVLIIFTVVCFVFFFKVRTVEVKGASKYSADLLAIKSGIVSGENLYSYKESDIESSLMLSYPYISRVKLKRYWPDRIVLEVSEDEPAYVADIYGETLIFSSSLRILECSEEPPQNYELCLLKLPDIDRALVGNKPVFTENADYITTVLKNIEKSKLSEQISYINLDNKFGIYFLIESQYKIKCGNTQDFALKLNMTEKILESGHIPSGVKAEINVTNPDESTAIIGEQAVIE